MGLGVLLGQLPCGFEVPRPAACKEADRPTEQTSWIAGALVAGVVSEV